MSIQYKENIDLSKLPPHWIKKECSFRESLFLEQKFEIPRFLADLLITKGINVNNFEHFINPKIKNLMPDPYHLLDIEKAAKRLAQAIKNKEKIVVYGDYDVDGATSSALLKNYMKELNYDIEIYIPDRIKDGYGPNCNSLKYLSDQGFNICIFVDSGTVAHEQIEYANSLGLLSIIIDHHISQIALPNAFAIINPNRFDQESCCKNIAAVGVTFLFLVVVNKMISVDEFFCDYKIPNLMNFLDIVALGTVCDMVPLTGLNRAFVRQGLYILSKNANFGLNVFLKFFQSSKKTNFYELTEYHLGFIIGPHINAGGRVGISDLGAKLLSTNNHDLANFYIEQLITNNIDRQNEEKKVLEEALFKIKKYQLDKLPYILLYKEGWHPGVIGIVAGRIKDIYHLPTFVISFTNEKGKASARSISGINIGNYILKAREVEILLEGGGHAMAGGFSILKCNIMNFDNFLKDSLTFDKYDMKKKLYYDTIITISDLNISNFYKIKQLSPFGMNNSEPKFIITNFYISSTKVLKDRHILFYIEDKNTKFKVKCIAFNICETEFEKKILEKNCNYLIFKFKVDVWQGRELISLHVEEVH